MKLQCHRCGAALELAEPIGRERTCDACGADVRCCINCRHYDPRYSNACTETMADPVLDKARRNFCEYFYYSRAPFAARAAAPARADEARAKLESLFGAKPAGPARAPADDARAKLDQLFRKPEPPKES
ncbi:MAG TPA: hypothetical protein VFK69_11730 [Candidatus Eisenbacteria bacterium]|nr:hypothetical protein [Candidatus Eisenbacteria bacterium]